MDLERAYEKISGLLVDILNLLFKRNYGPFLVALVSSATALAAGLAAMQTETTEHTAADKALSELLNQDFVPPREKSFVVTAAALNLLEAHLKSKDGSFDSHRESFAKIVAAWLRVRRERVRAQLTPGRSPVQNLELIPCPVNRASLTVAGDRNVFVPAQLACANVFSGGSTECTQGIKDGVVVGQAARAHTWTAELAPICERKEPSNDYYEVVQAYYITSNGAFTYCSASEETACEKYFDDDSYSLAERPYMIALRRQRVTEAVKNVDLYVDAGGMGILGTTCLGETTDAGVFLGAACVDYRPRAVGSLRSKDWLQSPNDRGGLLAGQVIVRAQGKKTLEDRTRIDCESEKGACLVPLSTSEGKWLRISRRPPNRVPLVVFLSLAALALIVTTASIRSTAAWRAAEARLGMLRDLPAGIIHVERQPEGRIVAASDHAEELLQRCLPSFVADSAHVDEFDDFRFWSAFDRDGFILDEEGAWTRCPDLMKNIAEQRAAGLASKYWVCLAHRTRTGAENWLEVVGTPELFATKSQPMSFSLVGKPNQSLLTEALKTLTKA
jgi:hypothetical protein